MAADSEGGPPTGVTAAAAAAPATPMAASEKRRAERCLFWSTTACQVAGSIVFSAMDQIFLESHRGDFVAHARMMSLIGSGSSALSFLFQPLIGSLIDVHGRKPLMILAGSLQILLKGLTALVPPAARVPVIVAQWFLGFVTYDGFMFARDAAMGDLWGSEPKELGRALSRLQTIRPVSSIVAPLVGGYLAARSVRLPYALAALLYGGAALIASSMPETLPPGKQRKTLTLLGASPLSALKLFTSGRRLRSIALLQLVTSVGDATRDSVVPVHRMQVTKWGSEQRGRFDSVSSAITVPGAALGGPLIGRLGNLRLLQLGLCSQLANALLLSQATAGRHFYWAAPAAVLTTGASSALSAMTMVAGVEAGLLQGELQGALSSLQMVVHVLAPLGWTFLYDASVAAGAAGQIYLCMAAVHVARLAITTTMATGEGRADVRGGLKHAS
jgi:MFS family permease